MRLSRYSDPSTSTTQNQKLSSQSSTHSHYRHLTHISDIILLIILPCYVTPTKLPTAAPWRDGPRRRPRLPGFRVRAHTHSLTHSPSARIRLRHLGVARTLHKDNHAIALVCRLHI